MSKSNSVSNSNLIQQVQNCHAKFITGADSPDNILWDLCMVFNVDAHQLDNHWQTFMHQVLDLNAEVEVHAPHQANRDEIAQLFASVPYA